LLAECYVYRRIREAFLETIDYQEYDPFRAQKIKVFETSKSSIQALGLLLTEKYYLNENNSHQESLFHLLQFALWGNQADLSLHNDSSKSNATSLQKENVAHLQEHYDKIIVDQKEQVWDHLLTSKGNSIRRIDFILDNAGPELFSDLVLADWLLSSGFATEIHFHVKDFGWFVSDVTEDDFHWTLKRCQEFAEDENMVFLGKKWEGFLKEDKWKIRRDPFWTSGDAFWELPSSAPHLYQDLSHASLVILKGDLNYRKLTYDCKWKSTTSFEVAIGSFKPSSLLALRTLKADVIAGLQEGQAESLTQKEGGNQWMTNGNYGVIQFYRAHF